MGYQCDRPQKRFFLVQAPMQLCVQHSILTCQPYESDSQGLLDTGESVGIPVVCTVHGRVESHHSKMRGRGTLPECYDSIVRV